MPHSPVGVESTGGCRVAHIRCLISGGISVIEIDQPHSYTQFRSGMNNQIDAAPAARKALQAITRSNVGHQGCCWSDPAVRCCTIWCSEGTLGCGVPIRKPHRHRA